MEKFNFLPCLLPSFFQHSKDFLNWQRKVFLFLVTFLLLIVISMPASAAVEGILVKDSDGNYHQYCYKELLESYAASIIGNPDGLFEDFADKETVAFLDCFSGYVDYSYILEQYANALVNGENFVLTDFTECENAIKAEMPAKVKLVSSAYGQLIRLEKDFKKEVPGSTNLASIGGSDKESAADLKPEERSSEPVDSGKRSLRDNDHGESESKDSKDEKEVKKDQEDKPEPRKEDTFPKEESAPYYSYIEGSAKVKLSQAQSWAESKNAHQNFIKVATLYWEYGKKTGIRPEVLYAQAAYETGYGHYNGQVPPEFNNWAGIKVAGSNGDEPKDHEKFASPEDGVRGHFNHMSAYVGLQPLGEPHDRYYSVKSIAWAGTVKYVEELSGKWAPSPNYHETIVRMIGEMK